MILKFKYHSDNNLLEAYQSYILAQNSSLVDSVYITSTADDADKYDYCLEFVCYNSKNIPKAQYISPILKYDNGITFTLPNNITEYKGHVDMQLTGYDPSNNSVVFKSIAKNCKAFDVEGSLNVLESDLGETPNVLTEVMQELEHLKNVREEMMQQAHEDFVQVCNELLEKKAIFNVKFCMFNTLLKECNVVSGGTCTPPEYVLPEGCVSDDKWYDAVTGEEYAKDIAITKDTVFLLNFYTQGLTFEGNVFTGKSQEAEINTSDIYLPEFFEGEKISMIKSDGDIDFGKPINLHICASMSDGYTYIYNIKNVASYEINSQREELSTIDGVIFNPSQNALVLYPSCKSDTEYIVPSGIKTIISNAFCDCKYLEKIILPFGVQQIFSFAITINPKLKNLNIPKGVKFIGENAVHNNPLLAEIELDGDISSIIQKTTFVSENEFTLMCTLEYISNYITILSNLNIPYKMKGEDALDMIYQRIDYQAQ